MIQTVIILCDLVVEWKIVYSDLQINHTFAQDMKKLLILLILISGSNYAQNSSKLELSDIFDLEYVSDPRISPDGKQIIYTRNFKDIYTDQNLSNLWIVNFDGSNNRPLTTGKNKNFNALWSPDGGKIIYKSREGGEIKINMLWMDTREKVVLFSSKKALRDIAWSPMGDFLAFSKFVPSKKSSFIELPEKPEGAEWNDAPIYITDMKYRGDGTGYLESGNHQLFLISTDGGTPEQLTESEFDHRSPAWGRDGKTLYFSANMHENRDLDPKNSEVFKLDLENRDLRALTNRQGPDSNPLVSPDGGTIAYVGYDDKLLGYQLNEIYVMNPDGSEKEEISADFDRNISNIQWAENGKGFFFQYDDHGITKIAHINLSGKVSDVTSGLGGLSQGRPYTSASFTIAQNGNYAFTSGKNAMPAELGAGRKGKDRVLTGVNDDLFSFRKLGNVEEIRWESSFDQKEMQGWIVTPPDFDSSRKYPLVLEIHGGPFSSYGKVFSAEIQLMAAAGYVVLYTNPRGSTGYGEDFGNLIHHDYPNNDYHDLMSGVDAIIERGYIDKENLFVTGGSGGGVLTAWIVGKTERFKAAVVAKPVINWYSFVLYSDNPANYYKYWFGKKPWEDPQGYMERSPLSYVADVTTPTMLLTGEEDYRTPIAESEQFYAALKLEKVETAMVRIPGASHGIANTPSNLMAKVAAILAWFDKYKTENIPSLQDHTLDSSR